MVSLEIHSLYAIEFHVRLWITFFASNLSEKHNNLCIVAPPQDIPQQEVRDPCFPSPCGQNSQCRNVNGVPSCSCLPTYIGAPPSCRPECTINAECPSNQACIREKCIDPCPGLCGISAQCSVINHTPICTCLDGYEGDAFTSCRPIPHRKCTYIWRSIISILTKDFVQNKNQSQTTPAILAHADH